MPWKCPACQSNIQHELGAEPQPGIVYRCAVCRLELVSDVVTGKMVLAPLHSDALPDYRNKPQR